MATQLDRKWVQGIKDSVAEDVEALALEVERLEGQVTKLEEVLNWALTALNVGDVQKDSALHLKLREVLIAYRTHP